MDKCSEKISEGAESLQFRGPTNLDNEELFSEAFSVEFSAYLTPLFQSSFLSCAISDSTTGSPPSIEDITTATASIFGATSISLIDRYTCDENFPWNLQFPSHRLDDHDTMLARLRQVLLEITDLLSHPQQGSSEFSKHSTTHFFSPDVLYIGIQFSLETSPGIGDEAKDQASESTILEELFDLSGKLAICQINNGEFEPPTLELEFEVGKSCHRNGDFEEAEHHCRRILQRHAHIDVQSFLGMVLSDASRTDEGRYLLFRALTGFITEFAGSPMCTNSRRFDPIQSLYLKVIPRDWTFMDLVMIDLMTTIEEATTKNSVDQFFQVLYAHGYSMAHQCFLHGMVRSAEYMYEDLLNPGRHLNTWLHGVEEAKAHQRFGIVLKNQRRLESSADQILLAYECVLNSGVHDSQFIELLQSDYMELVSLLPPTPLESTPMEPLQAKLKMVLDLLQNKGPEPQYAASDISCHSDINESLHEFPQSLATLPSSRPSISNTSFELSDLPLRGVNLRRGGASRTSTSGFSTEPSYKIGVSYTNVSGCTGVSISGLSGLSGL
ncbi:hypothetical protein BGZ60DRAFT_432851 [Tricladium varicosporioides]|nr:hypothetical protein BGZ60DRAFT_432851 [Hymenoscyphus varicosporioides]